MKNPQHNFVLRICFYKLILNLILNQHIFFSF